MAEMSLRPIRVVSFDCADTLMRVRWSPGRFAVACAEGIGFAVDRAAAIATYERLLAPEWPRYLALSRANDEAGADTFWAEITTRWADAIGIPVGRVPEILSEADHQLYGPHSPWHRVFPETLTALGAVRDAGYPMVVISNWDLTLPRALQRRGLAPFFQHVMASAVEGIEKPNPEIFWRMAQRAGCEPGEMVHVGDHPVSDVQGALSAGCRALWVNRSLTETRLPTPAWREGTIKNLTEVLDWLATA